MQKAKSVRSEIILTTETETAVSLADQNRLFAKLYATHRRSLLRVIQRYRLPEYLAEDLLQETFVRAMNSYSTLKNPSSAYPWLSTIAKNLCLMEIRKIRPTVSINQTDYHDESGEKNCSLELVLVASSSEESYKMEMAAEFIHELIANHKHSIRQQIAQKFYVENIQIKDIAQQMMMNTNTVLSHLRRFRLIITEAILVFSEKHDLVS